MTIKMCDSAKFLKNKKKFKRKKKKCLIEEVHLMIVEKNKTYNICKACWAKIADSGVEW